MPTPEFAEKTEFTDDEKLALIDQTMADLNRGRFADPEPEPEPHPPCPDCGATDGHLDRLWKFLVCWVRSAFTRRES